MFLLTSVGSYINYQEDFSSVLLTKVHYGRFVYHGKVVAVYPLRVRGTVGTGPLGRTPAPPGTPTPGASPLAFSSSFHYRVIKEVQCTDLYTWYQCQSRFGIVTRHVNVLSPTCKWIAWNKWQRPWNERATHQTVP